jgi:uncharacterized protein with PIN domain
MDVNAILQQRRDQWDRDHSIRCPHCDKEIFDEEYSHVSYHGTENNPREERCHDCEREFWVHEIVDRTYRSVKSANSSPWDD